MSPPRTDGDRIYCLSLTDSLQNLQQLADGLAQTLDIDEPPAISLHEKKGGKLWGLQAYYQQKPDLQALTELLQCLVSPLPELALIQIENRDWVALVQKGLSPVKAGRFFIHGSHDRALASAQAGTIEIDAGQAFGTAHHGTTRGCLLALDHLFKSRRYSNILDLGSGSGLLAIACARILKQQVLASDIDPVCVRIAGENAALNDCGPFVKTVLADGLKHKKLALGAPYDLLIANILAAPLHQMAGDIAASTGHGGTLILSGLLQTQSRAIIARYKNHNFSLQKRIPLDEWMTLILRRR